MINSITLAGQLLARRADVELRPLGLNTRRVAVLEAISQTPQCRPTDLALMTGIDKAALTAMFKGLSARRYIVRRSNADDHRTYHLELTRRGLDVLERAREVVWRVEGAVPEDLGEALADALHGACIMLLEVEKRRELYGVD